MRRRLVFLLVLVALCTGCGRREEPASAAIATPLPPQAFQVRWKPPDAPREIQADSVMTLPVTFTNAGNVPWPDNATADPQKKDGSYAVRLVHSWVPAGDPLTPRKLGQRTNLPRSVAAQETMTVPIEVRAPATPGEYRLVIELVQELVEWFSDVGADRLTIQIRVVPAGAAAPRPSR